MCEPFDHPNGSFALVGLEQIDMKNSFHSDAFRSQANGILSSGLQPQHNRRVTVCGHERSEQRSWRNRFPQ